MIGKTRNRDTLCEGNYQSTRYHANLSPESHLLSGSKAKRMRSLEMKENMSAVLTEKSNQFWNPPEIVATKEINEGSEPIPIAEKVIV